jgi:hypothetical protein
MANNQIDPPLAPKQSTTFFEKIFQLFRKSKNVQQSKNRFLLEETDRKLLEFLIAEFETTTLDLPDDPQVKSGKAIIADYKKDPYNLIKKSDIYKLETLILNLQPTERLAQRAQTLRVRYSEMAGAKLTEAYRPAPNPTPDKPDDPVARKLLLADLQQLLYFIHWNYFFTPIRERLRHSIVKQAAMLMAFVTIVWAVTIYWLDQPPNAPTYSTHAFITLALTVVYAGMMGGFISSQRRMQMVPTDGDALSNFNTLENGRYFLWFAPLTGAVFSVVLMILFMSGLVKGGLFPEFADTGLMPKVAPKDYALLFFWSFIAGFAEQFVPDALNHFISRGQEAIKTAPPPKPANPNDGDAAKAIKQETIDNAGLETENDQHVDGCNVETNSSDITPDEALPAAEGGVAK